MTDDTQARDGEFRPSDETTRRWGARQRLLLLRIAAPAGLGALLIAFARGRVTLILMLAGGVGVIAIAMVRFWYRGLPSTRPSGATWASGASLRVTEIRDAGLAHELRVKSERRLRFWTQGRYDVGCVLEVRPEGLLWTLGWLARLTGVGGTVRIAWPDVTNVEVGSVPGTISRLGGGITVQLANGHRLDGQFLGRADELRQALASSPLGDRR